MWAVPAGATRGGSEVIRFFPPGLPPRSRSQTHEAEHHWQTKEMCSDAYQSFQIPLREMEGDQGLEGGGEMMCPFFHATLANQQHSGPCAFIVPRVWLFYLSLSTHLLLSACVRVDLRSNSSV